MNAMVLLIFGIALFLAASNIILDTAATNDSERDLATIRSTERTADDLLLKDPDDTFLDAECSEAFFKAAGIATCGFPDYSDASDVDYLRKALGLSDKFNVNVSIETDSGILKTNTDGGSDYDHAIGPSPPVTDNLAVYHRTVSYGDWDGDGTTEYYTLYVRIWRSDS